ncbi:hypothetical protein GF373_07495 [bacterium]|nr:hypothetical protein [bacterium]
MYGNCMECGAFGRLNNSKLCKDCNIVNEQLLQQVREFLRNEGRKTVFELSEELSIPPQKIFSWIDSGKLSKNQFKYVCPLCGGDLLNDTCECTSLSPAEEEPKNPEKFYSAIRVEERRRKYWEEKSKIRRKQKRDIWLSS